MSKTVIIVVAILVVLAIVGAITGPPEPKQKTEAAPTTQTKQEVKKEIEVDLASEVQKAYLGMYGYATLAEFNLDAENIVGTPEQSIVEFTNKPHKTVHVQVQENITKQQATAIARSVLASASDVKNLNTVFVQGLNGTFSYVNKDN